MRGRIINLLLIMVLLMLDAAFLVRITSTSAIYPFERVMIGNVFIYNINFLKDTPFYGERLVAVNGTAVSADTVLPALWLHRDQSILSLTLERDGRTYETKFSHRGFNSRIMWFFMMLLMVANVHFLYGLTVRAFRSNSYQSRLFFLSSTAISLFYFCLIDLFSFSDFKAIFILVMILLGYITLMVGYNLSREKVSRPVVILFFIVTGFLFSLLPDYSSRPFDTFALKIIFVYLLSFAALAVWKLIMNMATERHLYIFKRETVIITGIVLAYVLPLFIYFIWIFYDIHPMIHLFTAATLLIPLVIGNSILQYNLFSLRLFVRSGGILFLKNIAIALTGSFVIYYISWREKNIYELTTLYAACTVLMIYVLRVGRGISRRVGRELSLRRDKYSRSLQSVESLAVSPEDLSVKLREIIHQVREVTAATTFRIVLFAGAPGVRIADSPVEIEHMPESSPIAEFCRDNTDTAIRYFLLKNSEREEEVFRLMSERKAVIMTPILSEGDPVGAILVREKTSGDQYNGIDINYIEMIAQQIGQFMENDRHFKEYIVRRRFEMELDIASYIQMRLFPKKAPSRNRLLISFFNRPFLKVTGDYFDFIDIDRDHTAIIIGDISGHGLAAAMVLSMTSSIMHAMLRERKPLGQAVEEINDFLNNRYRGTELITLFAGVYNNKTRELSYINAGHCAPLIITRDTAQCFPLEGRSKIIGADSHADYSPSKITLGKHDEMVLFTDGVVELYDEETGREFNEKKLIETILRNCNRDIEEKINAIIDSISSFSKSIRDDITLIAVRFL
jgi:sigma-B regulation protein RsbU (phosphoserine phosphatase)